MCYAVARLLLFASRHSLELLLLQFIYLPIRVSFYISHTKTHSALYRFHLWESRWPAATAVPLHIKKESKLWNRWGQSNRYLKCTLELIYLEFLRLCACVPAMAKEASSNSTDSTVPTICTYFMDNFHWKYHMHLESFFILPASCIVHKMIQIFMCAHTLSSGTQTHWKTLKNYFDSQRVWIHFPWFWPLESALKFKEKLIFSGKCCWRYRRSWNYNLFDEKFSTISQSIFPFAFSVFEKNRA